MKFFCEYCGNRIDANIDRKCPNCGASYKKNKKFLELEAERKKQADLTNEYAHKILGHVTGTMKFSKIFIIIPVIAFVMIFITILVFFNTGNKMIDNFVDDANKVDINLNEEIKKEEEKEVTVNFGEYGSTSKYRVKVVNYEVIEDKYNRLDEGYEYVEFDLVVENLTDHVIDKEDVNCIVEGIAQKNYLSSGYSDLPFDISKKLAVTGTAKFIVPKNATSYDIRYGDYVTIHIVK